MRTSLGEGGARRVAAVAAGTVPGSEKAVSAIMSVAVRYVSTDATCKRGGGRGRGWEARAIRRSGSKAGAAHQNSCRNLADQDWSDEGEECRAGHGQKGKPREQPTALGALPAWWRLRPAELMRIVLGAAANQAARARVAQRVDGRAGFTQPHYDTARGQRARGHRRYSKLGVKNTEHATLLRATRGATEATHTLSSQATPRTISAPAKACALVARGRAKERATCNVPTSATYRHPLGARSEDLVRHCLRLHLRDAVDLLELLEELGLGRVARLLPRAEGVERDLVRVGVRAGRVWESVLPSSALSFIQGKCPFEAVASGDRRGELEVEAAAAHGAVHHGALERLKLGQVLVDEIGDLDEGRRASLACRWASNVCACAQIRLAEARSQPSAVLGSAGGCRSLLS